MFAAVFGSLWWAVESIMDVKARAAESESEEE